MFDRSPVFISSEQIKNFNPKDFLFDAVSLAI